MELIHEWERIFYPKKYEKFILCVFVSVWIAEYYCEQLGE